MGTDASRSWGWAGQIQTSSPRGFALTLLSWTFLVKWTTSIWSKPSAFALGSSMHESCGITAKTAAAEDSDLSLSGIAATLCTTSCMLTHPRPIALHCVSITKRETSISNPAPPRGAYIFRGSRKEIFKSHACQCRTKDDAIRAICKFDGVIIRNRKIRCNWADQNRVPKSAVLPR